MGIIVQVLRNSLGDSTADGVSKFQDQFVVGNTEGPFSATGSEETLYLKVSYRNTIKLVTQREIDTGETAMAGGNFASSSDSRFKRAIEELTGQRFYGAVAIHDRYEN
jgi:hypothetical protein